MVRAPAQPPLVAADGLPTEASPRAPRRLVLRLRMLGLSYGGDCKPLLVVASFSGACCRQDGGRRRAARPETG